MYAFRSAAEAGDSRKQVDIREGGERVLAARRAVATTRRSLSDTALKTLLAEDLTNLLNTTDLESAAPELVEGLELVRKSILNYGLPDLSRRSIGEMRNTEIQQELRDALLRYEPRLIKRSMRVTQDKDAGDEQKLRFIVQSDMRADPVPTSVEFVTDVDFELGGIRVSRL
jgi:type VI secretion system protein ImpF